MKLAQVVDGSSSAAAIQEGGGFRLIPGHTVESLLEAAQEEGVPLADFAARHAGERVDHARIEIPVRPAEVWACGCTYAPSADFRDGELGTRDGMYSYVHKPEHRPEIFSKAHPGFASARTK